MTPIPKKETKEIDLHNATWELLELHQELRDSEADVAFKKFQDFIRQLLKEQKSKIIVACLNSIPKVSTDLSDAIANSEGAFKPTELEMFEEVVWNRAVKLAKENLEKLLTEDSPQKE